MGPFCFTLVAEMTSQKQAISKRARGVPWERSLGLPCGTRGFTGEPRSESTCPCGGKSTFWPLGGVARIATIKTIAAYESQRIMPIMPNWELRKVYEACQTVKCLLISLTCYMLGYYILVVLHVAYCKPGLHSLVAPQGGRRISCGNVYNVIYIYIL